MVVNKDDVAGVNEHARLLQNAFVGAVPGEVGVGGFKHLFAPAVEDGDFKFLRFYGAGRFLSIVTNPSNPARVISPNNSPFFFPCQFISRAENMTCRSPKLSFSFSGRFSSIKIFIHDLPVAKEP